MSRVFLDRILSGRNAEWLSPFLTILCALLSLVGIFTILMNLILSRVISEKRMNLVRVQMRDAGMLMGTTASAVEMIETIKGSGSENGFFRTWAGYQASVNTQTVKYARLQQYLGSIPQLLTNLSNYAVLLLGVWLCMQGKLTHLRQHPDVGQFGQGL